MPPLYPMMPTVVGSTARDREILSAGWLNSRYVKFIEEQSTAENAEKLAETLIEYVPYAGTAYDAGTAVVFAALGDNKKACLRAVAFYKSLIEDTAGVAGVASKTHGSLLSCLAYP